MEVAKNSIESNETISVAAEIHNNIYAHLCVLCNIKLHSLSQANRISLISLNVPYTIVCMCKCHLPSTSHYSFNISSMLIISYSLLTSFGAFNFFRRCAVVTSKSIQRQFAIVFEITTSNCR